MAPFFPATARVTALIPTRHRPRVVLGGPGVLGERMQLQLPLQFDVVETIASRAP
jgi:hypothetical protein